MPVDDQYSIHSLEQPTNIEWDRILNQLPQAHILQSGYWADLKRPNGWQPSYYLWTDSDNQPVAAAVLHQKPLPILPGCILYCPRGPVLDWTNRTLRVQVLSDLHKIARQKQAVFLKVDPEVALAWSHNPLEGSTQDENGKDLIADLQDLHWRVSPDQLQFRNTVLLDLLPDQGTLLAGMKQKTRYNIRLAQKKGVVVRPGTEKDLDLMYQMYAKTSLRDGFAIRAREYYLDVWSRLMDAGIAFPLLAEVEDEAVSGLVLFVYAGRGYYFYGMSTESHRDKMPNHLLQWEAICKCKQLYCRTYDFWGAPDDFDPEDKMYGVYKFKEGFNGQVLFGLGAWDLILNPTIYWLYTRILPVGLNIMRWLGRRKVQQEVQTI